MALGQLRTTVNVSSNLTSTWQQVMDAWRTQWVTLHSSTCGVDAPELYTERSLIARWATALTAAFPRVGLGIVERPVPKQTASGSGLLDLWLTLDGPQVTFDYAIEAKPYTVKTLNPVKSARKIITTAATELHAVRMVANGGFAHYTSGASVGVICRHTSRSAVPGTDLDAFETSLWTELNTRVTAMNNPKLHGILATHPFGPGLFSPWKSRDAIAAYSFFLAEDS